MTDAIAAHVAATPAPSAERRTQVERLLFDILRLMQFPARIELRDMPDGGIGVALHFEGELPGITPGKRTYLVDCLQFLLNKVVNRPNVEKRWVTIGVNGFPEPRAAQPPASAPALRPVEGGAAPAPAAALAPAAARPASAPPRRDERGKKSERPERPERRAHSEPDEVAAVVAEDPAVTKLARALAEKCAKNGRAFGVMMLSTDDRQRMLAAVREVKGVSAKVEGESHLRRLVLTPDKVVPMPRRAALMQVDDDEED